MIFSNQNIHIIWCGGENVVSVIHAHGIAKALHPDRLLQPPTPTVHRPSEQNRTEQICLFGVLYKDSTSTISK